LREHINAFTTALSKGDFVRAFTLCPAMTWKKPEFADPRDTAFFENFLSHAIFQAIDGQEVIEGSTYSEDDPKSWCKLITPPKAVNYEDMNLEVPDKEGEVLANVHLKGECTDITGRYRLVQRDGRWLLTLSGFEIM
jgi:hypothetical protein